MCVCKAIGAYLWGMKRLLNQTCGDLFLVGTFFRLSLFLLRMLAKVPSDIVLMNSGRRPQLCVRVYVTAPRGGLSNAAAVCYI